MGLVRISTAGQFAMEVEGLRTLLDAREHQIEALRRELRDTKIELSREIKRARKREAKSNADSTQKNIHPRDVSRRANY